MSGFAKEWWDSRPSGRWIWRTVSLLVLLSVAGVILSARSQGAKNLAERYRWSASQAIQSKDWNAADLWLKKLATLEPKNENLDFVSAIVAEQRNERGQARLAMERLAQTQYTEIRGAVGLWMAHDILRQPELLNLEGLNLARDLLTVARRNSSTSQGETLISDVAMSHGFTEEAAQVLGETTERIDKLRLKLAERLVGVTGGEGSEAASAVLPKEGTVDYYLRLAEGHALLKAWTDAEQVLLKGLQEQNDARLRRALAELYVIMSLSLEEEGKVPLPESIRLARLGYSLSPDSPMVLDRLAMLLRIGANYPPEVQDRLISHLRSRLSKAEDPRPWQVALGLLQMMRNPAGLDDVCPPEFFEQNPEARVVFAKIYRERGDVERCQAHAQLAIAAFRSRLSASPNSNPDRISLAESLVLMNRWKEAVESLTTNGVSPHAPELKTALANVYLDWSAHSADIAEKVNHLLTAWQVSPREPMIIVRLLDLTRLPSELSQTVLLKLEEARDQHLCLPLASLVLGSSAASKDDFVQARLMLEAAYRDLPDEPILLNNLAWVLVRGDERDPKRALKLINRAISLAPSTPELRETRGHIYFELRQWDQAIADLKTVSPMFPERSELHVMLSKAFQETNQPELAFRHRQLAMQTAPRKSAPAAMTSPAETAEPVDEHEAETNNDAPVDALKTLSEF